MGEDKRPGVIKRLDVRSGATGLITMTIGIGYILSYVKLAVVKCRRGGVIRKRSTWLAKHVTIALLRGICKGTGN